MVEIFFLDILLIYFGRITYKFSLVLLHEILLGNEHRELKIGIIFILPYMVYLKVHGKYDGCLVNKGSLSI